MSVFAKPWKIVLKEINKVWIIIKKTIKQLIQGFKHNL